jgi:Tol biopolymer transport system component
VARQSGLFVYRRGHTRQLTHRGTHPSWSPNGRRIAYVLNGVLYVIRPDGSGRRRIFNTGWRWSGPISWSPNNRRILIDYRTKSGLHRIATIRSDGRGFRRLARLGHVPAFPFSYSPDGRWIVFARDAPGLPFPGLAPGNNDPVLMTMRADGKRQRRIRLPSGRSIRGIPSDWQPLPR